MLQNTKTLSSNNQVNKNDEFERNWIDFLCIYGNKFEYIEIEKQNKMAMFAIMKYRRLLRNRGLSNIPFITLNTAYTKGDYIRLHSLMQELFLEVINEKQFQFILEQLNNKDGNLAKLYDSHIQDENKRILNRVMLL